MKVLVIPSWYPNEADPLWGNYFIKQAEALAEYADIDRTYIDMNVNSSYHYLDFGRWLDLYLNYKDEDEI